MKLVKSSVLISALVLAGVSCKKNSEQASLSSSSAATSINANGQVFDPVNLASMKKSGDMLLHDWEAAGDNATALSILQGSWNIVVDGHITSFVEDEANRTAEGGVLDFENIRRINNNGGFWDVIGDIFFGWLPEDKDRFGADMSLNFSKKLYEAAQEQPFSFANAGEGVKVKIHPARREGVSREISLGNYGYSRAQGLATLALTASKVLEKKAEKRRPSVKFAANQFAFIDAPDREQSFIIACESDPDLRTSFPAGEGKVKYFAYYANTGAGAIRTLGCLRLFKSSPGANMKSFLQMRVGSRQPIISLGTPTSANGPFKSSEWITFAK